MGIDHNLFLSIGENQNVGRYIFGSIDAAELMHELFNLVEDRNTYLTCKEKDRVIKILQEMLPSARNIRDIEMINEDTEFMVSNAEIERLLIDYEEAKEEISKSLEIYYRNELTIGFYEKRLYEGKNPEGIANRKKWQKKQYEEVCKWEIRWRYIIEEIVKLRIVEKYWENNKETKAGKRHSIGIGMLCQSIEICRDGGEIDVEAVTSEENCRNLCREKVEDIIELCKMLEADCDYVLGLAFDDLAVICSRLKVYRRLLDSEELKKCRITGGVEWRHIEKIESIIENKKWIQRLNKQS